MRRLLPRVLLAAVIVASSMAMVTAPAQARGGVAEPVVLVSGLNNPRQLSLLDNDTRLLVAEAGQGGGDCVEQLQACVGATGSVTLVEHPAVGSDVEPDRIVTGLLSAAAPDGGLAVGSDGVSARGLDRIFVAMTYAPPDLLPSELLGVQAGKMLLSNGNNDLHVCTNRGPRSCGSSNHRTYADISAVELATDPDGQGVDSNPYAVLDQGRRQLVADAGGNDILQVKLRRVTVFAVLPNHDDHQSVPTSLAVGPNGTIYVGELNGANPGTARVWRLSPSGQVVGWIGGFSTVSGVAIGPDGALYVSELFGGEGSETPGQVTKVARDGVRTHIAVPFPAGIAVDRHNRVYVSAWSISDSDGVDLGGGEPSPPGQVWRLSL